MDTEVRSTPRGTTRSSLQKWQWSLSK